MATLLESKFGFGLVCLLGAALAVTGVVYLRGEPSPAAPAPAPASAATWDGPLGPGALAAPARAVDGTALASAEQPLLDAGGRLAIDAALHRLFDAYLKGGAASGESGAQALRAYLKRRLTGPALSQAESLADAYRRYLQAEAALRANERLAPPDRDGLSAAQLEKMLTWQQQRAQLRERMLGAAVSQAWFGTEDVDCRTALVDWRLMHTPAGAEDVDSNELRARRLHGARLEESRNARAQSCAAQLMDMPAADSPAA
jgi:hypothetical protein